MLLDNTYYTLISEEACEGRGLFRVALRPDCEIYKGHFPRRPVSPGVCNIRLVQECASRLVGQPLHWRGIRQCRFTALVTPESCPRLDVSLRLQGDAEGWKLTATLTNPREAGQTYMELKGELCL